MPEAGPGVGRVPAQNLWRLHPPGSQMASQPRSGHKDTGDLGLGFVFHELQEGDEVKAIETSVTQTGGDNEKKIRSEPEQGAGAEEESHICPGEADPMFTKNQKACGGHQESWQPQPEESAQDSSPSEPQPQDQQRPFVPVGFSGLQLKELESIFRRSQYPDVFARKQLAIRMDVSEAKVEASKPDESN
ncbi:hypothetical protein P7K49_039000 [Saguinus oedipus]|uniref:Homeobox domain-containing protein n=1 Tax=Saguinus oedipus TaxID=9490 RepID=A0ABQ9TG96_SAGOE|nr:hypothetical protein P7K49_039000 [Saguinus oedipus]